MLTGHSKDAPILEFDEDDATSNRNQFFNAGKKEFWRFIDAQKRGIFECILFFPRAFSELKDITHDCTLIYEFKTASTISPVYLYKDEVFIALCPLGGPAVANLIEELSHVGIRRFIGIGSCGCLDNRLAPETLIVPTSAIRDEGLSYHYLPASRDVGTSALLNKLIGEQLTKENLAYIFAKVWTTDAIYRETPNRIERRKQEGAIAVEMECASLAAVCKNKGLEFSQILYISDTVESEKWNLRVYDKIKLRTKLCKIAYEVLHQID